ncbi:MAG: imidazoleglycerol-phosphate dehydratase [Candidatus Helarchaeota archaeon]
MQRIGKAERKTKETDIEITVNLDGTGNFKQDVHDIGGGTKFILHMLDNFARHSLIDIEIKATADLPHHLIEDMGIVLGEAFNKALGDKKGINRFGWALVPMDDVLCRVALDLSGRIYSNVELQVLGETIEDLPLSLLNHFIESLINQMKINMHGHVLYGDDNHHKVECFFKALALAMKWAVTFDPRKANMIPSTKGSL